MPNSPSDTGGRNPQSVIPQLRENVEQATAAPAGANVHVAKKGDCISSIAKETGHFWKKIWNDPGNSTLKSQRDPNVLHDGDRVVIPEKTEKEESGATEMEHEFVRKGEPAFLRIRVEGHANESYVLDIDGVKEEGTTDDTGLLEHPIPGNAKNGKLVIGPDEEEFKLQLGGLAPIETVIGAQQRLNNLAYDCGNADDKLGPKTKAALVAFQSDHELKETAELDADTKLALKDNHGS